MTASSDDTLTRNGPGDGLPVAPPPVIVELAQAQGRPHPSFLGPAVAIVGAYLGVQGSVGVLVGACISAFGGMRALIRHQPFDVVGAQATALAPSLLLSTFFSSGALLALTLLWTRGSTARTDLPRLGLVRASRVSVLAGLLAGLGLALAALYISPLLAPEPSPESLGALAVAVSKPGAARIVFSIFGILIAPIVEEALFRGVLYGGLRERLSPLHSAVIVTAVFVVIHVAQYWRYWPGLLSVLVLGVVLAAVRLRQDSIGPGIAIHFSYNVIAVASMVFA